METDVRPLLASPAPAAAPSPPGSTGVVPGLRGVVAAETRLGDVRGEAGFYHYGPYDAVALATSRPLEDVWFLFAEGRLPAVAEQSDFAMGVAAARGVPGAVARLLPALAAAVGTEVLKGYAAVLPVLAAHEGWAPLLDQSPAERAAAARRVVAVTPVLLAALHRAAGGQDPVPWPEGAPWAAGYLEVLTGRPPAPAQVRALETYLVATVDHGFNASTFTARVVASTGADLGAVAAAAVGALSGPLHGGAPSRALDLLDEIDADRRGSSPAALRAAVDRVVGAKLAAGERIMGFGHAVYRTDDPRAVLLRSVATELADSVGSPLAERAVAVEERILELLADHRPGRVLRTNVELYAGVVLDACGVPRSMFTPTFASSRVIGWCAHAVEQAGEGTIIRPAARYVGAPPPQPVRPTA